MVGTLAARLATMRQTGEAGWFRVGSPTFDVLVWALAGIVLNTSWVWLYNAMWVGILLPLGVHALSGVAMAVWNLIQAVRLKSGQRIAACIALFALLPTFFFGQPALSKWGGQVAFAVIRPEYDRVVLDVAEGRLGPTTQAYGEERDGLRYAVAESRRDLVVFRWLNGVPDGGAAIVHDAARRVANEGSSAWNDLEPTLSGLLVGPVQRCETFAKPHFFICHFS